MAVEGEGGLRFGDSWISHQADVDVSTDLHPIIHLARATTHHQEQQRLLHVLMSKDLGGDRLHACDQQTELLPTALSWPSTQLSGLNPARRAAHLRHLVIQMIAHRLSNPLLHLFGRHKVGVRLLVLLDTPEPPHESQQS